MVCARVNVYLLWTPFSKITKVGITGLKWHKIKTTAIRKMSANTEEEEIM
jgi:hypothetical protein